MSVKKHNTISKSWVYILAISLIISAILAITVFVPQSPPTNALFSVSIRSYTTGYTASYYTDYAIAIKSDLSEVGIDASVISSDYATFLDTVVHNHDYELAILEVPFDSNPRLEAMFKENASLNVFGYKSIYDNGSVVQQLKNARQTLDLYTRKGIYYGLEDFLMDKIVPMVPLFTPVYTFGINNYVQNFSADLGLSNSLPYMSIDNSALPGTTENELRIGVGYWDSINPLETGDATEQLLVSLFMDKLINIDNEGNILPGGLIKTWKYVNATTLLLTIRNNAFWQPDKDNKFVDRPFTIDDLLFTIEVAKSPYVSCSSHYYNWIKDVFKYNSSTVELIVDSDPSTPEQDPYAYALQDLSIYGLPEYYLNVTGPWSDITSSDNWIKYSNYPFGTGKYKIEFENSDKSVTLVMDKFDKWYNEGVVSSTNPVNIEINKLWINTYRDDYSLLLSLKNDDVDLAFFRENAQIVDQITENEFSVQYGPVSSLVFLAFNLNKNVFGGKNNFVNTSIEGVSKALAVRKAIAFAINRAEINKKVNNNAFIITDSILPAKSQYYYSGVTKYEHSIPQAVKFLKAAGLIHESSQTQGFDQQQTTTAPINVSTMLVVIPIMFIFKKLLKKRFNKNN